jgi:Carboxypeptidase regulatory-like domain
MHRVFVVLPLLLACVVRAAAAQVAGRVVDERGDPVAGAAVELWAGDRQAATHTSDAAGRFAFGAGESRGASGLLARHPGYRPARVQLGVSATEVTLRLAPEPVMLDGVTARAAPHRLCPNRESSEARALWAAAAARYSRALDTLAAASLFAWDERTVASEAEVGPVPPGSLHRNAGVRNQAQWRWWRPERSGYAVPLAPGHGYAEFGAWYYPLEILAPHLVSEVFGTLHTLSVVGREAGAVEIGFCPRAGTLRGMARVEGTLRISTRDTLVAEAHVEFRTRAPDEHAGADLVYAPAAATDGRPLPVPSTELFWRRPAGRAAVFQRYREYQRWEAGSDPAFHGLPAFMRGGP